MLLFYRIFCNQKHSTRKCIQFIGVEYLVRIVNSRGEEKLFHSFGHRKAVWVWPGMAGPKEPCKIFRRFAPDFV